ncbi:MAG: threonylcarbamoyl-AMP synthase [Saccharofermentans sp.]|nr:threonylcarbamoyl-AMP synthase [Saccharofermentans sp.]
METKFIRANDKNAVEDAARALREGQVVAFPTETVYGLGANACDASSVAKIFEAKGRPSDNPLIVHIHDLKQVDEIAAEVTPLAKKLMDSFMPGPITVIVKKSDKIPFEVTAGLDTVGIRMPSDKTCNEFLKACDCPVAAPSANLSGSPSPTSASHVMNDMNGRIYAVIDGGESIVGLESTVVDATGELPVILRPGAVTKEMIERACLKDTSYAGKKDDDSAPMAPGMKYRHYAPNAEVVIVPLTQEQLEYPTVTVPTEAEEGKDPIRDLPDESKKILFDLASPYIMKCREILDSNPVARIGIYAGREAEEILVRLDDKVMASHIWIYPYGDMCDASAASHGLFAGLRHLDLQGVDVILAAGFPEDGIGKAYMNRLSKASVKSGEVTDGIKNNMQAKTERFVSEDDFNNVFTSSVLFVCDDNKTLSASCESIMRMLIEENGPYCSELDLKTQAELYTESAGLYAADGEGVDKKMAEVMKEETGRSIDHHLTSRACASVYDDNDLILALRDEQAFEIADNYPELSEKVYSISSYAASKGLVIKDEQGRVVSVSIPDPKGENKETYIHTVRALRAWLEILFPYILKDLGAERI